MTPADFRQLARLAPRLEEMGTVGVFSPRRAGEGRLLPRATGLPRWRWDLGKPGRRRFDLLVACNVFMYSPDPERWFRHVFACCGHLLLLDIVRRRRSGGGELGKDGDSMRYAIGGERPRPGPVWDLAALEDRRLAHRLFPGGANEHDEDPLHFVALFRGDLAEPVICLDGYPGGAGAEDRAALERLLGELERRRVWYHLGITGEALDDACRTFLRGLQHARLAVSGRAARGAAEPRGLLERRQALARATGRPATSYVALGGERAPQRWGAWTGWAGAKLGRALAAAGYERHFAPRALRGCELPCLWPDFQGRSSDLAAAADPAVVALDLAEEAALARLDGGRSFGALLDRLAARAAAVQARGERLAAVVTDDARPAAGAI